MRRGAMRGRSAGTSFAAVLLAGLTAAGAAGAAGTEGGAAVGAASSELDKRVAEASIDQGQLVTRTCANCHLFKAGAGFTIGPNLFGVAGRRIANTPSYAYSKALSAKAGESWSNENLDAFLSDPAAWAPGTRMTFPGIKNPRERAALIAYLRALPDLGDMQAAEAAKKEAAEAARLATVTAYGESQRLVREGLVIDLALNPVEGLNVDGERLWQGDRVEVAFSITDEATGEPVPGLFPGAWMDLTKPWGRDEESAIGCKDRAGLYLQGQGIKPLIDMNSYFMLVLNQEPVILVFDPLVNVSGKTMLYAQVNLEAPGADWVKSEDDRWLFVSMPQADQVAVVDTNVFKVKANVDAGVHPVRVSLQPDGKYLWVGNDSKQPAESGVTVIDAETLAVAAMIPTGAGHHEIAFSDDSRYAFVTNRGGGTVSVIDVQGLKKVRDIQTGPRPISMAFSPLSKLLYVADAESGEIAVIDPAGETVETRIAAMPGLGPLRFSQDGRWGMVVNPAQDLVHVIDASFNRLAQDVSVGTRPYQVSFSRAFAYVRSLDTERVSMINLQELEKGRKPPVITFAAGDKAPQEAPELNLASAVVEAPGEAAVLVVSPGDSTVYYYMEGMNAPMGSFRNYGQRPLAVEVVDQALREKAPGVYASKIPLPEAGTYEIAFIMDSPQILHCFTVVARPNPAVAKAGKPLAVEFLVEERRAPVGESFDVRFQLTDPATGRLRSGLADVRVLSYRAPSFDRRETPAEEVEPGVYRTRVPIRQRGAYYVHVSSRGPDVAYGELPYLTLIGVPKTAVRAKTGQTGG